jgi:hypothetical protein
MHFRNLVGVAGDEMGAAPTAIPCRKSETKLAGHVLFRRDPGAGDGMIAALVAEAPPAFCEPRHRRATRRRYSPGSVVVGAARTLSPKTSGEVAMHDIGTLVASILGLSVIVGLGLAVEGRIIQHRSAAGDRVQKDADDATVGLLREKQQREVEAFVRHQREMYLYF